MGQSEVAAVAAPVRCFSSSVNNGKRQRTDEMRGSLCESANEEELIPGLPNDIALQCMVRVPVQAHAQLQRVSRKWRELVNSNQFYEERKRKGTTMYFVCAVQALPVKKQQQQPKSTTVGLNAGIRTCSLAASSITTTPSSSPPPVFGVNVLNPRQRTWERLSHIPQHPHGLPLFCRLVAVNGNLVVLGGWDPLTWETLRSVYVYSFSSQSWHRGADMPSTRSSFACAVLNHRVFVAGGHDNRKSGLATAEVYNLRKDEWTTLPRMSEERDESTAVALNGKLYVISGYSTDTQGQFVKSADIYEPENNSWTRIEDMMYSVQDHINLESSSSSSGIKMAVQSGTLYTLNHKTLFSYSTTKNTWSSVTTLPDELLQQQRHQLVQGESQMDHAVTHVCLTAINDSLVLLTGSAAAAAGDSRSSSHEELNHEEPEQLQELVDHQAAYNLAFLYKPPALCNLKSVAADSGAPGSEPLAFKLSTPTTTTTPVARHSQEIQDRSSWGTSNWTKCNCASRTHWRKIRCRDVGFRSVPQFACAVEV